MRLRAAGGQVLAFRANKRKTLESAQKYVQKGAFDKALKEYTKLLQADPTDSNVRLKIGDLHLKKKNPAKAIESYIEVAEIFSRDGFDAKAVAIYKQILRIDPESIDARIQLGELYQRLGLVSEALRELQAATTAYQDRGQKREAFDLLKRLSTLDPSNVPNRLTLADLMAREGMEAEARDEYEALLSEVQQAGSDEMKVRVCEFMLGSFPDCAEAVICLAKAHIGLGSRSDALDVLQKALVDLPDDLPVREAIVSVYEELGDQEGAGRVYREIAELYRRRGDHDQARDILQRYVPVEPFSEPETPPSMALREMFKLPEAGPEAEAAPSGDPLGGPDPHASSPEDLLAEARISLEFDNLEDAETRARQLLQVHPHSDGAKQVLGAVAERRSQWTVAQEIHQERHELASATGDAELVAVVEEDLRRVRARRNEAESAPREAAPVPRIDPPATSPPEPPEGLSASTQSEPLLPPISEGRIEAPPEETEELQTLPDVEIVLEDEFDHDDAFVSIEPPSAAGIVDGAGQASPEATPDLGELEALIDIELGDPQPPAPAPDLGGGTTPGGASSSSWAVDSTFIAERIDAAETIYARGDIEAAEPLFREILDRAPRHPQALLRLGEIANARGESPEDAAGPDPSPAALADTQVQSRRPPTLQDRAERGSLHEEAPAPPEPAATDDSDFDVVADFSDLLDDEPGVEIDVEPTQPTAPTSETTAPAVLETPITPPPQGLIDPADWAREAEEEAGDFDLAAELHSELDEEETSTPAESGFDSVFSAFKKGIQDQLGADDCDARYDLAIAYREMGLLEDAVEELERASRSGSRQREALAVLATTQMDLGRAPEAVAHLRHALELCAGDTEQVLPLRYDLGLALAACGEREAAIEELRAVAAADPGFRDVRERLAGLEA